MLKLIIVVSLLTPAWCLAQKEETPDEKKINFDKFWYNTIPLPDPASQISTLINISGFRVIDARFDTSTIGFMQKGFPDTRRKLKLEHSTTKDIQSFFDSSILKSNHYEASPGYEILCVIKKLWLSDEIYASEGNLSVGGEKTVHVDVRSGIMLRLDFFAFNNREYTPLYRYDTTVADKETIFRNGGVYLAAALAGSLSKLGQFSNNKIGASKKVGYNQIEQINIARFDAPILKQTPRKGIYMSFEEFKNNQPSITEYRIDPDEKTDEIYAKDKDGKEMLLRNTYGFSDGTEIYVAGANNFFKLHKASQTFNMYGAKSLKKSRQYFTAGKLITMGLNPEAFSKNNTKIKYKLKHHPYQLDMETGDFY